MKKTILRICSGLLIVTIVLAGMFKYYIKPKYVTPLVIAVEEFLLEDTETIEMLLQEYEKDLLEDLALDDELEKDKVLEVDKPGDQSDKVLENTDKGKVETKGNSDKKPSEKKASEKTRKTVIGDKTMADLQAEVEPGDLKTGLKIASKIDTGHLIGLAKGGLTAEKKQEVKSHLTSRLTPSEYSQLRGFVGKYAYLLK